MTVSGHLGISVQRTPSLPLSLFLSECLFHFLISSSLPHPLPPSLTPAYLDPLTLWVVPGVELKQLSGIVGERVHVDAVPQHNYDSVGVTQHGTAMRGGQDAYVGLTLLPAFETSYLPHPQSSSGSLVMAHAHSQHWLGEGELQHQLVLGVLALPGIVPDQHCWAGGFIVRAKV